ncbi:S8 family serine peptidase [Thalassotalea ponticola]|uniref:S8 family serine peptidase n=1 Tax=Thalassotalea ponticola TaxID=1523392 RepID=UPI0025B44258|nr:S8 family serine peptidase [Thalassotalea ponticola]MDN3651833.1 S8 family serine peptidase [Thalassotalea ponticola]
MKSVALAIGTVLYSYSAIAAANDVAPMNGSTLKGLDIPQAALSKLKRDGVVKHNERSMKNPRGSVNRHLQPLGSKRKFVPEADVTGEQTYIIRLNDNPVATYNGHISGYEATALNATQATGEHKLFSATRDNKQAIAKYENYLLSKQGSFLQKASNAVGIQLQPRFQYTTAFNGMSVRMTQEQAVRLAKLPEVASIQRSRMKELLTDVGPEHIEADKAWTGDTVVQTELKGEGMIVGIIDTGVNTDHVAFADIGGDGYDHTNPWGEGVYVGDCTVAGQEHMCNDKLIGVRSYSVITDVYDADEFQDNPNPWAPNELIRPKNGEDYNGHGSHVAGTAAGNVIFDAPLMQAEPGDGDGIETGFTFPRVSGVAPHANIISYQVCYPGGGNDPYVGCPDESILASIEDAIKDGVDAINFSIGGGEPFPWEDAMELGFLAAREAGINVAVAAGNAGHYNISHTAPWQTIVAASEHGREIAVEGKSIAEMSGGDTTPPMDITGGGISDAYSSNIVLAASYGDELCAEPFPEGTFNGEIVVCKRGELARVAKADNVLAGGAGGFVLYNEQYYGPEGNIVNDVYSLPGAHIDARGGSQLVEWLSTGEGHMATITASEISTRINEERVDVIADFSSRGPSVTHKHLFVPTIAAPGVGIYAPYADEHPFTMYPSSADWASLSGTSMASPHVAGALTLVQQAHPEWTPTEVQSALQMTATPAKVVDWQGPKEASFYDAGTGVINVANAINAGLIMDESIENFMDANPQNGGDPRNLNLPQVLDMNCKQKCVWVRTVKATRDGTWTVSTETSEYSVKLRAYPETFELKAGDIQTILIEGEVLDSQNRLHGSELEVHGKIRLTADNPEIPSVLWPAALRFDHGALPTKVESVIHRDSGKEVIGGLQTEAIQDFTSRAFQPEKANVIEFTLPQDDDSYSPFNDGLIEDSDKVVWIDVPAGSKRVIAEMLGHVSSTAANEWDKGVSSLLMGIDANGDGEVQLQEEAICWSNAAWETNWCNINNPDAGKYWVVVHNHKMYWDGDRPEDTYRMATAVVSDQVTNEITVTGPTTTDGIAPYAVEMHWNFDGLEKGEIVYSAFDIGTDAGNPGNVGLVPVRLERGVNEVSVDASQDQAKGGDIVDVTLKVVANKTGQDRNISLAAAMPEGATLIPGSVSVKSQFDAQIEEMNNGFTVEATQFDSRDMEYEYVMTTSLNDAMCMTPNFGGPSDGGYVDLQQFGIYPSFGGNTQNVELPFNLFWYDDVEYALYDNHEYAGTRSIHVSPRGYVELNGMPMFFDAHLPFPYWSFPDQMIGVMWKGGFLSSDGASMSVPFMPHNDPELNAGVSVAMTQDKQLIIEWDNAQSETYVGTNWDTWEPIFEPMHGDSYDFQVILNMNTSYNKGDFEIIKAYDNLDFGSSSGDGSIGVQGFHGARSSFAPLYGYKGTSFSYNGLQDKLEDDLIICYDLVGPEASQFEMTFQARINENATGNTLVFNVDNNVEGLDAMVVEHIVEVPSNIKVGAINDQMVAEDSVLEGIMVAYSDSDQGANTITVTGDNISATVHGHEPGSMIDIIPAADFSGETEVFVTVTDNLYPSDSYTTSFMLTVMPEADMPTVAFDAAVVEVEEGDSVTLNAMAADADGDALTFEWEGQGTITDANTATPTISDLAVGEYEYTVTVSDGMYEASASVTVSVVKKIKDKDLAEKDDKSSGGSLFYLLLLLPLVGRRALGKK